MPLRILRIGGGGGGGAADFKNARRVASITPLPAYTRVDNVITATAVGALPAIDGINLVVGESFLFRNGAALADNGLWDVTDLGDGATQFVLTRSADADTDVEVTSGMRVPILAGSFAGQTFVLVTADPIVLNTTGLVFALDTGSSLWKEPRRTATDTALPTYTRVGNTITANAVGALPSIAGVSLVVGDSFVFRNGAALEDNGLWDVSILGNGGTAFQLTRSADASTSPQMSSGMRVPVTEGTYAGQTVYLSTQATVTLNTTPLTFSLDALPATRPAVRTVTEVALPTYTRTDNAIVANANGALPAISGVTLAVGDALLLRTGASATDNGLWAVTDLGSGGTPYRLIRAPDANVSAQLSSGLRVAIPEGSYAGRTFYLATQGAVDLNTTALTFSVDAPSATFKGARRTASSAALPAYTRAGNVITGNAVGALPSIGGVALAAGESFLLRDGAAAVDNGLWDVTVLGDAGTAFQLTRSADANINSQVLSGLRVPISEGVFARQAFTLATADPIDLNVTGLSFTIAPGVPPSMFTAIAVTTGAYASNEEIPGVVVTPGWTVIAEFQLDTLPSQGAVLDAIMLVSGVALTGSIRLYDVTGAAAVAGSTITTVSLTGQRMTSANLTSVLVATRRYQIQAEVTGGGAASDFGVVRYATLISS